MVAEPGRTPFRMTEELTELANMHTTLSGQLDACPPEFQNTVGFPLLQNFQMCFLNTGKYCGRLNRKYMRSMELLWMDS